MRRLGALRRDEAGMAIVEFAIVAPVMITLVLGLLEFGYVTFARSTLESAILDASRASRVSDCPNENADLIEARLDERMAVVMSADGKGPELSVQGYGESFGDVGNPEPFDDDNGSGGFDPGETYTDVNGNGQWDEDMGSEGDYGSFGQVVRFTATYNVPALFPWVANVVTGGQDFYTVGATTVVRNEPYREAVCS